MAKRALALDLGTSSVRAIVFETEGPGTIAAVEGALARRPRHLTSSQPGQATFDVEDYFADLVACIDELSAKGALDGVEAVGTDSQWHSILPVDHAGRPLGALVSWADTRPPRPAPAPSPGAPALEELRQRTGCAFAPMYWTWRAPWLTVAGRTAAPRGNAGTQAIPTAASPDPGTDAPTSSAGPSGSSRPHFMGLTEYVGLQLLDDPSISVSMASATGLLATATRTWDAEALELAGVKPDALPPLAPPDWRGRLSQEWRCRWPALAEAAWHPALGDGAAANLGVGCDGPGRAALTVGTSAAVRSVRPAPDTSRLPAGLWRYCVDDRRVVVGAAYSSGGQLYAWALALSEGADSGVSAEVLYDQPMPVGAGSDGVVVLPWHAGTRPPAPGVPAGQGCVLGLGLGHTGSHIVSAAVEAVCFQLAGGLADVESIGGGTLEILANGGAIDRSEWWKRRLASTLARPVHYPTAPETTARGAAALALGVELGHEAEEELMTPDPDDVARLAHARQHWATWYEQLLPITSATRG